MANKGVGKRLATEHSPASLHLGRGCGEPSPAPPHLTIGSAQLLSLQAIPASPPPQMPPSTSPSALKAGLSEPLATCLSFPPSLLSSVPSERPVQQLIILPLFSIYFVYNLPSCSYVSFLSLFSLCRDFFNPLFYSSVGFLFCLMPLALSGSRQVCVNLLLSWIRL